MLYSLCLNLLYFMVYSMIGWACETVWCSVGSRKLVNRGFLAGPVCPIYGFGALAVLYLLRPYTGNLLSVFLAGVVLTSFLEYVTGWALEKFFHLKLWDYSGRFCNLNGRVCLRNSLLFGLLSVLLVWLIHPALGRLFSRIPPDWAVGLAFSLFTLLAVDVAATVQTILQLNGRLEQLNRVLEELREKTDASCQELGERLEQVQKRYEERLAGLRQSRRSQRRVMKAFPDMSSIRHPESLAELKKALAERRRFPKKRRAQERRK